MKNKTTILSRLLAICLFLWVGLLTRAQEVILAIQSPNVVLLDVETGNIVNPTFFEIQNPGTPKDILQVGDEIWISHQIGDRIDRYDLEGNFLSSVSGGMDNIKGMGLINNSEVWVTNAGTNNGAPGNAIVRFDLEGNNLGFFSTPESSFDVIDNGAGEVYISYINSMSHIERRDYNGNVLGNVVEPDVLNFVQQIQITASGDLLVGAFSSPSGVYIFDIATGNQLEYWVQSGVRGVFETDNGSILWTSSSGIHRIDPSTGTSTMLASGAGQFFGRVNLNACTELPNAPTGDAQQDFCAGALVSDLVAQGSNIKWYTQSTGGIPLDPSTELVTGNYYASQTVDGCESEDRLQVQVSITDPVTPSGDSSQTLPEGSTIEDIVITPSDVTWFGTEADALAGTNPLAPGTLLEDGETYWAVNIENDCLSEPFPVTITIVLGIEDNHSFQVNYYPNPTQGLLFISSDNYQVNGVGVLNLLGQEVKFFQTDSNEVVIDLSELPRAIYFVKVNAEEFTQVFRIVKD